MIEKKDLYQVIEVDLTPVVMDQVGSYDPKGKRNWIRVHCAPFATEQLIDVSPPCKFSGCKGKSTKI
jgi:hypothetical protein